jgi:hypothetical protein
VTGNVVSTWRVGLWIARGDAVGACGRGSVAVPPIPAADLDRVKDSASAGRWG